MIHLSAILNYCLLFTGSIFAARCANPVVRKEIRQLTPTERSNFFRALRGLHTQKSGRNGRTGWEELSEIHLEYNYDIHGVPSFLPWHRVFLKDLERRLQLVVPSVVLPYWDWTIDSQSPERSVILSPGYFGGNGAGNGMCVRDGVFANQEFAIPEYHCLARNYDGGDRIGAFYPPEALDMLLDRSRTYDDFRQDLEGAPHARVHMGIGGDGGDLKTMHAPNDPLFYMHHSFIDLLWHEWQLRHPDRFRDYDGLKDDGTRALPSDPLPPYRTIVSETFDILDEQYCYTYPRWSAFGPRQAPPQGIQPQGGQNRQTPNPGNPRNAPLARASTPRQTPRQAPRQTQAQAQTPANTRTGRNSRTRAAGLPLAGALGRRQLGSVASSLTDVVSNALSSQESSSDSDAPDEVVTNGLSSFGPSTISNISGTNTITQTVSNVVNNVNNVQETVTNTSTSTINNISNTLNVVLGVLDPYNRDENDTRYRQPPAIDDKYLDMMKVDKIRVRKFETETTYYLSYINGQPEYKPKARVLPKYKGRDQDHDDPKY